MNLVGQKVSHKSFGTGVIIEVYDKYLGIDFSGCVRKIQYPDTFAKFMKAEDSVLQQEMLALIDKKNEVAEEKRKQAEIEKSKTESVFKSAKDKRIDDMFGEDYHANYLARHPILTYQQVESQFGIKISGFGRGINPTQTSVVLISSISKSIGNFVYHDKWTSDGDYIYSGEGRTGDQTMTKGNLAIKTAARDNKKIHLFVKFSPKEYYYQGEFTLIEYFFEDDRDESGNVRKEYKFRLRKI